MIIDLSYILIIIKIYDNWQIGEFSRGRENHLDLEEITKKGNGVKKKGWSSDSIKYRETKGTRLLSQRRAKKSSLTIKTIRKWLETLEFLINNEVEYSFLEREIETTSFQTISFLWKIDCIEKQASINLWKRYTHESIWLKKFGKRGSRCRIERPSNEPLRHIHSFLSSLGLLCFESQIKKKKRDRLEAKCRFERY